MKTLSAAFGDLQESITKLKRSIFITIAFCLFGSGFALGLLLGLVIQGSAT